MTLLVYGWYGRGNIGDELMKQALKELFEPRGISLRFVDKIESSDLLTVQGVIFGGGSILNDAPDVTPEALDSLLTTVPVFYVGVGIDYQPHPVHVRLLDVARVVARRTTTTTLGVFVHDLVFSLSHDVTANAGHGLLIVPNVEVIPTAVSPNWMQLGWLRYVDELSQALDHVDEQGLPIQFLVMCTNTHQDDGWAASTIISHMTRRKTTFEIHRPNPDITTLIDMVRRSQCVITQRYHGIILAEMAGVPYVSIDHHDKLTNALPQNGEHISYHGMTKAGLLASIEKAMTSHFSSFVPDRSMYHNVVDDVARVLNER